MDSVGGTPTKATGTVALPKIANDRGNYLHFAFFI